MPIHIIPGHSKLVDLFNWHKDTVDKAESREVVANRELCTFYNSVWLLIIRQCGNKALKRHEVCLPMSSFGHRLSHVLENHFKPIYMPN